MKRYIFGVFVLLGLLFCGDGMAQPELDSLKIKVGELERKLIWEDKIEKVVAKKLKDKEDSIAKLAKLADISKKLGEINEERNENVTTYFWVNIGVSYALIIVVLFIFFWRLSKLKKDDNVTVKTEYLAGGGVLVLLIFITFMSNRLYVADTIQSQLNTIISEREVLRNTNLEGQTYDKVISLDNKMEAYKLELQRQNDRIEILAWVLGGTTFFALLIGLYELIVGVRQRLNEALENTSITIKNEVDKKMIEEVAPKLNKIAAEKPELLISVLNLLDEETTLKTTMKIVVFSWVNNEGNTNQTEVREFFTQMRFKEMEYKNFNKENVETEKNVMLDEINQIESKNTIIFLNNHLQTGNEFNKILENFNKNSDEQKNKAFFCLTPFGNENRLNTNNVNISNASSSLPALYNNLIDLMRYKKNVIDKKEAEPINQTINS